MKKYTSRSIFQRVLSAVLCLSMLLSVASGTDFSELLRFVENASENRAAPSIDTNEYKNETLEHMWDSDGNNEPDTDFLDAARPYYTCRDGSYGGVEYRTIFHVYAFEGDTICVGSSVFNSTLNINHVKNQYAGDEKGSIDVVMTDLNGNTRAIDIRNSQAADETETNTTGYIPDWQTEWAAVKYLKKKDGKFSGTYTDSAGKEYTYTPYTYTVTETGVYTFEFHSYNKSDNVAENVNNETRSQPFHDYTIDYGGQIAAINLTVFDESGYEQHGRTYADFLSLQMHPKSTGVVDTYYILTTDSYIYKMKFNDIKPYTYNFFVNNTGIYDTATNEIIYKSVKSTANNLSNNTSIPQMGAYFKYPGTKDTELSKSYYIFLEYPDDDLYGYLYERAVQPDPATNIRFVDYVELNGTKTPGAYEGVGGYFAFDVEEATTATLRLEFGGKLSAYAYAPVEISGVVTPHSTNYFYWDGCDGNGTQIPEGKYDLKDIVFTVTTKAGEIHFPITDMESAPGGITFERMSHIYDKSGNQLDTAENIYGLTKNLIYYDDSAIYYGENIASVGISENQVDTWKSGSKSEDENGWQYFTYDNMKANAGEYNARQSRYIQTNSKIKIGDHSHTTNIVQYFDSAGNVLDGSSQEDMIEYLNSDTYPVGLSKGGTTTTDYGIANYWTFIPSKPEHSEDTSQTITIVKSDDPHFNLIGRVFYDADNVTNGKGYFSDMNKTGEYLMNGVTVNLYKKTASDYDPTKTYVNSKGEPLTASTFASGADAYELVSTGKTSNGSYTFSGLEYSKDTGTEYLYQVVKPNPSYRLTTGEMTAAENSTTKTAYYYYANYTYDTTYKGTEIQIIKVGGTDGIDPTKKSNKTTENPNHTVCAVDVGYHYEILPRSLMLKKTWDVPEDPTTHVANHPNSVVYEVDYRAASTGAIGVYAFRTMSAITSWQYEDEYLPDNFNEANIEDYYVAAEYYIEDGKIYRHTFEYDSSSKKYHSFVGKVESATLEDLSKLAETEVKNFSNISDLSILKQLTWSPVTSEIYRAVLDRNTGSDSTTITITNAKEHGTIEIFKYSGENIEGNALQGATFRVYELTEGQTLEDIQKLVSEGKTEELRTYQVGSATTRENGRIAFTGLDPSKTYVVREMYPPAGYRILNEFYEVRGQDADVTADEKYTYKFDKDNNYVRVEVGNAPADSNFYILKRIEGRAWQDNDSFSFTITNPFDSSAATEMSSAEGIRVDASEMSIVGEEKVREETEKFAANFKADGTGTNNKITVKYSDNYYSFFDKDIHGSEEQIEYTYPDRKMSGKLLIDGKGTSRGNPTFCEVKFPMAGVYTFTIKENDITSTAKDTLTKSPLEYTVTINVTRVRNAEIDETVDLTTENSHLEAEISSITYKDTSVSDSVSQIYAGSSPLFTNIYAPAPAKQDTNYNIVKNFTGRTDDEWLSTDNFTVRVSGVDEDTKNAIENGNIVINGFAGALGSSKNEWVHEFDSGNKDTPWEFESFTFNNIIFPVQYVKKNAAGNPTDEVWNPDDHDGAISPPKDVIDQYSPQTLPVTYWLKIEEDIPAEATGITYNGITYDNHVYYLQIILRNAEAKVSVGSTEEGEEEEDGIIDEIDMKLYHVDKSMTNVTEIEKETPVATCYTQAEVLEESAWREPKVAKNSNETYAWFWVDNDGVLHQDETHDSKPADAKLLVRRHEVHFNAEGTDGHTMTFSNVYHTSYAWAPTVEKVLNRDGAANWLATDKFKFTIEWTDKKTHGGVGVEMPETNTIEIDKDTTGYKASFSAVKFSVPGDYNFTITETDASGKELAKYNVTVTVEDMHNGTLKSTIKDSDSAEISNDIFQFTNTYESTSFDLGISKTVIGRDWKEDDKFTFKITPNEQTKKAIEDGIIKMPGTLGTADTTDGSYTVTIDYDPGITDNKITKSLGEVVIENITAFEKDTQYKFTIEEVTTDLKEMYCREPSIDLFITVTTEETGTAPSYNNQLVATYAHRVSSDTESTATPTDKNVTIPFENVALGKLTVAKKVVTNAGTDSTEFGFTVEFTYADEKDHKITVSGAAITSTESGNTLTYSFTLTDGENIVFSNIPPKTQYTITETNDPKYTLLRVRNHETDDGDIIPLTGNQVSGTINLKSDGTDNQQYRLFVNGLIKELPSSGGLGTKGYICFGTALTVGAIALLAVFYFRRRKRGGASE